MDYKAIARAITDPENQPHQWSQEELAKFFVTAADEIERLREALRKIVKESEISIDEQDAFNGLLAVEYIARSALKQKDSE